MGHTDQKYYSLHQLISYSSINSHWGVNAKSQATSPGTVGVTELYRLTDIIFDLIWFMKDYGNFTSIYFVMISGETVEFQPAMITLFNSKNSDEMMAREAVKEHLWGVYFSDYGRWVGGFILEVRCKSRPY